MRGRIRARDLHGHARRAAIASGAPLNTAAFGPHALTVTATDAEGHVTVRTVNYTVVAAAVAPASGYVVATLALALGPNPSFGAFAPGVTRTYTASTTATVTSTAGDATLSVSDPGHLANGAFTLPVGLEVIGVPKTWSGPTSNEVVTIGFRQQINATDALRTGTYSRTLTFTLSTTQPQSANTVRVRPSGSITRTVAPRGEADRARRARARTRDRAPRAARTRHDATGALRQRDLGARALQARDRRLGAHARAGRAARSAEADGLRRPAACSRRSRTRGACRRSSGAPRVAVTGPRNSRAPDAPSRIVTRTPASRRFEPT